VITSAPVRASIMLSSPCEPPKPYVWPAHLYYATPLYCVIGIRPGLRRQQVLDRGYGDFQEYKGTGKLGFREALSTGNTEASLDPPPRGNAYALQM
jgi:hypothetical protein